MLTVWGQQHSFSTHERMLLRKYPQLLLITKFNNVTRGSDKYVKKTKYYLGNEIARSLNEKILFFIKRSSLKNANHINFIIVR